MQLDEFVRRTSELLSSFAMFVHLVKIADTQKVDTMERITSDLTHIEETVLHNMLCNLKQIHSERVRTFNSMYLQLYILYAQ